MRSYIVIALAVGFAGVALVGCKPVCGVPSAEKDGVELCFVKYEHRNERPYVVVRQSITLSRTLNIPGTPPSTHSIKRPSLGRVENGNTSISVGSARMNRFYRRVVASTSGSI